MTKAKSKKSKAKTQAAPAAPTPRVPKISDKDRVVKLVEFLQGISEDETRSIEQCYQATRIDWFTVRRLFRENARIFQATSGTARARYTLTAAGRKAKTS